eukprot:g67654.t1
MAATETKNPRLLYQRRCGCLNHMKHYRRDHRRRHHACVKYGGLKQCLRQLYSLPLLLHRLQIFSKIVQLKLSFSYLRLAASIKSRSVYHHLSRVRKKTYSTDPMCNFVAW